MLFAAALTQGSNRPALADFQNSIETIHVYCTTEPKVLPGAQSVHRGMLMTGDHHFHLIFEAKLQLLKVRLLG